MTDIQINPIAMVVLGLYLSWLKKDKISGYLIVGEILGVVFWLSVFPLLKWVVGEYSDRQVVSFWVYCRFMLMVMGGRTVEWLRWWRSELFNPPTHIL